MLYAILLFFLETLLLFQYLFQEKRQARVKRCSRLHALHHLVDFFLPRLYKITSYCLCKILIFLLEDMGINKKNMTGGIRLYYSMHSIIIETDNYKTRFL